MIMKCTCVDSSVKLHLEGALEHYIKDIRKDITRFAESAVEYKDINPELSKHYLQLVESQKAYIEKIETAKSVIKALPICGVQSGNPYPKELNKMPLINPHASAIRQDKELKEQLKWLKLHGFKDAREAREAGH